MMRRYCDRCKEFIEETDNLGFSHVIPSKTFEIQSNRERFTLCKCCYDVSVRALRDAGLQVPEDG
jgi:hypothetical protein